MTSIEEARSIAARSAWLSEAAADFRLAVLERCVPQRFDPLEVVYAVGDGPGGIYCLISGSVRVSIASAEDGPFFAHIMRPGTWIGEGPLITRQPRLVGLSAGTQSDMLLLPLPAIQAILERHPAGWRQIALLSFANLQTAVMAMNDLMIRDDTRRLVATLLRLAGARFGPAPEPGPIAIDLSHEELAAMANLARTTASAILHRLVETGHVTLAYRRIILVDAERLRGLMVAP